MLRLRRTFCALLLTAAVTLLSEPTAAAQRHSGLSSPPTAPPAGFAHEPHASGGSAMPAAFAPVSMGLGALEFFPVNIAVAAPQSIVRQLTADDERTRQAALNTLGVPSQYLLKGHVPFPHSIEMSLAPLSNTNELDALLTIELDHHLVTGVLMPQEGGWHRVATVVFPTAFSDPSSTPSTFLRTTRSLLDPTRYRAVFHAHESQANGDYTENEAHLRILNNRAIITTSFVSDARTCEPAPAGKTSPSCTLIHRWLRPDVSTQGVHRFQLVTASGTLRAKDVSNALGNAYGYQLAHLRTFTCQPFTFSDSTLRYEATGPSATCRKTIVPVQ